MKREFLTVYDYGQGGVWTLIRAKRAEDVEERYPELRVITEPPGTMTAEESERIRWKRTPVDLDDREHPFLRALREHSRE